MTSSKPQFVGKKVTIGELGKTQSGGTPSSKHPEFFNGSIPWIGTTALNGKFLGKNDVVKLITEEAVAKSATKIVPEKSIMVGIRVGVGKVAINAVPMCTSQDIVSIVGIDEASWNKEYISLALQYKAPLLAAQAQGATIAGITSKTLKAIEIPAIPINEQNRVVDILRKLENQVGFVRKQLCGLDALVKSRFVEMFGDLKSDTNGWPIKPFETFAIIDTHMANDLTPYLDMPHIGIDSIESGTGRLSGYRTVAEDGIISGKYPFTPEHLIYSKIRPSLNKVALPDFSGVCSSDAYPILPIAGECNRVYLAEVMRSAYFLEYILPLSGRAQMPKVNKKALSGFSMPLPPIELQQQFAAFVAQVDKSRFGGMLRLLNSLSGIMHASFFSVADTD